MRNGRAASKEAARYYLPAFPGISVRTLHDWKQGRRVPSGPAKTLLAIALAHLEILCDIAAP